MFGSRWTKIKLLKRSRKAYNAGKYNISKQYSRLTYFIFRDSESLDILARSYLNLNSFSKSAKAYRRADKAGYRLLDHDKNHFKAGRSWMEI